MEDVIKKIRINAIKSAIGFFVIGLIPNIGFIIFLTDSDPTFWFFLIWAGFMDWIFIKYLIVAFNPTKDNVFKKYGSPKDVQKILDNLNKNKIYEDDNLIMSNNYITRKKDYSDLVCFKDILGVHKLQHKRNGFINYFGVVLTDKYGFEHSYNYEVNNEKQCDELLLLISSLCPNAELGYTKKQKQHIKENKEKLPNTCEGEKKAELFACSNCGAICKEDDKFCENCKEIFDDEDCIHEEIMEVQKKESDMDIKYRDLTKLKKLLDKDIISKEEFEKEKKKILK